MSQDIPGLTGFVVREIRSRPDCSSAELYERSLSRYPAVASMGVREFHARYVLKVRKQLKNPHIRLFPFPKTTPQVPPQMREEAPESPVPTGREAVRLLLFRLAMDLETSQTQADVVDLISRLDDYVNEGLSIVGS